MSQKLEYSYTILRYVHDIVTGESINVGVLLHAPKANYTNIITRKTIGRVKSVFPDLDRTSFVSRMKHLEKHLKKIARTPPQVDMLRPQVDATYFAKLILPTDDSSLQWSQEGVGLSANLEHTLAKLFDRLVHRYDEKHAHRRTDDEVWKPIQKIIQDRKIKIEFIKKTIRSDVDDISFKKAWKNGAWHCYEPLSLDLADAEGIKDKARRWLGHIHAVNKTDEQFKAYFILGKPQSEALLDAYEHAALILKQGPSSVVYKEEQFGEFVDQLEDQVHHHNASKFN